MTKKSPPTHMRAVAIDRFGGIETLKLQTLPVPALGPGEILLQVEWAGVGEWDPFEREGGFAKMLQIRPQFPLVLGSEGAGVVAAIGPGVRRLKVGDRVYASGFLNPKGGFYAEYAAVKVGVVARIPKGMTTKEAGVMSGVALTALRGLDDTLALKRGEKLLIFGASGALGHLAVQLAKKRGARVLAVASGKDGVALVKKLGADAAVDGRKDDVFAAAREFAPEGLDAALFAAGGGAANDAAKAVRKGGRIALPNGVMPAPKPPAGVKKLVFDGDPDADILARLGRAMKPRPIKVHIDRVFPLTSAASAHRALSRHHLGKLALRIR